MVYGAEAAAELWAARVAAIGGAVNFFLHAQSALDACCLPFSQMQLLR